MVGWFDKMAMKDKKITGGKTKSWNGVGMSRKHDAFNTGTKKFAAKGDKKKG